MPDTRWMHTLRGAAMILVVLLHAGLALDYYATEYPRAIEVFNQAFEPYRMPTLMFLSGMLLSRSLAKAARPYYGGKARKILWPYAVWTVIALGLQGDLGLHELARAVYNPVETHLWYLWFLIIFYAVARLLERFGVPAWAPAIIALVASGFLPEPYRLEKMAFLFAFFMLGHLFQQHYHRVRPALESPIAAVSAVVLAATASGMNIADFKVLYEPIYAAAVLGTLALAVRFMPRVPRSPVTRALDYVGKRSIVLYVTHLLAIKVAGTVLQQLGLTDPWLMFPTLIAVGVGSSLVLMVLSDRWRPANYLFEFPNLSGLAARRDRQPTPA